MAEVEGQGTQAYCPRCGFTPRAPRTTCPICARALVTDGPEGTDGRRSAAPLVVLGVGFVLATGGLLVANAMDTDTTPAVMGAGIPRLAPPQSGVLGTTESGGDRKKDRRDAEERSGRFEGDDGRERDGGDSDDPDGSEDRAGSGEEGDDRRPEDVGDLASTPPLLPPVGSDDPDDGAPVPPLDGEPGMPPPLAPVADLGDVPSGDDSDDDDDEGDGRGREAGEHTVVLASEEGERRDLVTTEEGERRALAVEDAGLLTIARRAAEELADDEPGVPVGVFEACDLPDYEDGELIAFAGRFDAERNAEDLLERLGSLGDDVLFIPDDRADRCPGDELVDDRDGDEIDLTDVRRDASSNESDADGAGDDLPGRLGEVPGLIPDGSGAGEPRAGSDPEGERPGTEEDADEGVPDVGVEQDPPE